MKNKEELKRVWLVWSTSNRNTSLAGIFTDKEKAKRACKIGDSIYPIKLDYYEEDDIDTTPLSLYKAEDGKFVSYEEIKKW